MNSHNEWGLEEVSRLRLKEPTWLIGGDESMICEISTRPQARSGRRRCLCRSGLDGGDLRSDAYSHPRWRDSEDRSVAPVNGRWPDCGFGGSFPVASSWKGGSRIGADWIGLVGFFSVVREGARLAGSSRRGSQARAETVDSNVGMELGTEVWTMLDGR